MCSLANVCLMLEARLAKDRQEHRTRNTATNPTASDPPTDTPAQLLCQTSQVCVEKLELEYKIPPHLKTEFCELVTANAYKSPGKKTQQVVLLPWVKR